MVVQIVVVLFDQHFRRRIFLDFALDAKSEIVQFVHGGTEFVHDILFGALFQFPEGIVFRAARRHAVFFGRFAYGLNINILPDIAVGEGNALFQRVVARKTGAVDPARAEAAIELSILEQLYPAVAALRPVGRILFVLLA